jgi:hypothetical protein
MDKNKEDIESLKKIIMPDKKDLPKLEDTPSDVIWNALKKSGIYRTEDK